MESDLVLEIVLYVALLGLMLVIRWWQTSKHLYQRAPATVSLPRPVIKLPPVQVRRRQKPAPPPPMQRDSSGDELSWRKLQIEEKPKVNKPPKKLKESDGADFHTRATSPKPVIDLRPAFENFAFEPELPMCPPNSPVAAEYGYEGLDPSFDAFKNLKDEDFERRRSYVKKQVTDGEVMMKIATYEICQIFVHGIEYHYVFDGRETSWDIPKELESISNWFLKIPKSRRRRAPDTPPVPLEHVPDNSPVFI